MLAPSYTSREHVSSSHAVDRDEVVRDFSGLYHRAVASRKKQRKPVRREIGAAAGHPTAGAPPTDQLQSKLSLKNMLGFMDSVSPAPAAKDKGKGKERALKLLIIDDSEETVQFFIRELIEKRSSSWSSYYPTVLANALSLSSSPNPNAKGTEQYLLSADSELLKCVTVTTTNNGRDGLHYLRNEPFDLVFINLNVPMFFNAGAAGSSKQGKEVYAVQGPRSTTPTPSERRPSRGHLQEADPHPHPQPVSADGGDNTKNHGPGHGHGSVGDLSGGVLTLKKFREYIESEKQAGLNAGPAGAGAGAGAGGCGSGDGAGAQGWLAGKVLSSRLQAAGATEKYSESGGEPMSVSLAFSQKQASAAGVEVSRKSSKNSRAWQNNLTQANPKNVNYSRSDAASGTHVLTRAVSVKGSATSVYTPHLSKEFSIHGNLSDHEASDNDHDAEEDSDDEDLFINEHALIVGMGEDCSDQQIAVARKQNMHYFCAKPVEPVDLYSILGAVDYSRRFYSTQDEDEDEEAGAGGGTGSGDEGGGLSRQNSRTSRLVTATAGLMSSGAIAAAPTPVFGGKDHTPGSARRAPSTSPPVSMQQPKQPPRDLGRSGEGEGEGEGEVVLSPLTAREASVTSELSLSGASARRAMYSGNEKSFRSATSIQLDDLSCSSNNLLSGSSSARSLTQTQGAAAAAAAAAEEEAGQAQLEEIEAAATVRHKGRRLSAPKTKYNPQSLNNVAEFD